MRPRWKPVALIAVCPKQRGSLGNTRQPATGGRLPPSSIKNRSTSAARRGGIGVRFCNVRGWRTLHTVGPSTYPKRLPHRNPAQQNLLRVKRATGKALQLRNPGARLSLAETRCLNAMGLPLLANNSPPQAILRVLRSPTGQTALRCLQASVEARMQHSSAIQIRSQRKRMEKTMQRKLRADKGEIKRITGKQGPQLIQRCLRFWMIVGFLWSLPKSVPRQGEWQKWTSTLPMRFLGVAIQQIPASAWALRFERQEDWMPEFKDSLLRAANDNVTTFEWLWTPCGPTQPQGSIVIDRQDLQTYVFAPGPRKPSRSNLGPWSRKGRWSGRPASFTKRTCQPSPGWISLPSGMRSAPTSSTLRHRNLTSSGAGAAACETAPHRPSQLSCDGQQDCSG